MAGVDTPHYSYTQWNDRWARCRDVFGGEDDVKARKETYLPRLDGQPSDVLGDAAYDAYLSRAQFFGAFARAAEALVGAMFRKMPSRTFGDEERDLRLVNVDLAGTTFNVFAKTVALDVLVVGRYGVLLDLPADEQSVADAQPFFVPYCTEDLISWRTKIERGQTVLDQVVVRERIEQAITDGDGIGFLPVVEYRVFELDEAGFYRVRVFTERLAEYGPKGVIEREAGFEEDLERRAEPRVGGSRLRYVPFVFFGPLNNDPAVSKPPLLDLANINLGHYRRSADLEQGRHVTALPTPWVQTQAASDEDAPPSPRYQLGGPTMLELEINASAGYLEFSGAGLAAIQEGQRHDEERMARLGARLLETPKRAVEAADSMRIRQSSESMTLTSLTDALESGFAQLLKWWASWTNHDTAKVVVEFSRDFVEQRMDAAEAASLMALWMRGAMSKETLLWNFEQGEMLPPDITAGMEIERIRDEGGNLPPAPDEDDSSDDQAARP